ncbi:MAG TPA: hypothetical protein VFR94_25890 [Nitrososphaeraceae archaeon]|nr:hypothetical protein [Nitrososphaeraceae archaeon]
MTHQDEKKYSKDDSIDLDARARVTFAATAEEDIDDADKGTHQENISDDDLKSYLEVIMNEVKKKDKTSTKVKNTKNQVQ